MAMWTILKEIHGENNIATGEFAPFGEPYDDKDMAIQDKILDLQMQDNQGFCYAAEAVTT